MTIPKLRTNDPDKSDFRHHRALPYRLGQQTCGDNAMPFTRISLLAGRSPAALAAIADSLDRAMVDSFDVPENDRFVAFHQHQPGELIFDRHYRGGPRSDDFVLFHITTGWDRPAATKRRFFQALVSHLEQSAGLRPEDVLVVIANSGTEDWSFSHGLSAASQGGFPAPSSL
jgi:phenylpyruvate tautomerase PptA (4-oxalocrotonate tautomerase family)